MPFYDIKIPQLTIINLKSKLNEMIFFMRKIQISYFFEFYNISSEWVGRFFISTPRRKGKASEKRSSTWAITLMSRALRLISWLFQPKTSGEFYFLAFRTMKAVRQEIYKAWSSYIITLVEKQGLWLFCIQSEM